MVSFSLLLAGSVCIRLQAQSADAGAVLVTSEMPPILLAIPAYPKPEQTAAHFRWPMRFEVWIDKTGRVISVRSLDRQTDTEPFLKALRAARFKPASLNGVECDAMTVLTLDMPDMSRAKVLGRS